MKSPILSVVIPAYNEEESIGEFVMTVIDAIKQISLVEIIVVDDGSSDNTASIVRQIATEYPVVHLVRLHKNSGHMAAITAGLKSCSGDWVATIDADGQDDPYLIPEMIKACTSNNVQICFMGRENRNNDPLRHRIFSPIFYRFLSGSTGGSTPIQAADFRLMSKKVVSVLNLLPETNRVYRVLVPTLGFQSITLSYERRIRHKGDSKYSFFKLAKLGIRSFLATSGAPLRWVSFVSICFALLSLMIATIAFFQGFANGGIPGWASLALMISTLFFFQSIATLVICEFLLILLADVRQRPLYQIMEH
jgi:glycosyltransferase involved in cell wall biosynthesis